MQKHQGIDYDPARDDAEICNWVENPATPDPIADVVDADLDADESGATEDDPIRLPKEEPITDLDAFFAEPAAPIVINLDIEETEVVEIPDDLTAAIADRLDVDPVDPGIPIQEQFQEEAYEVGTIELDELELRASSALSTGDDHWISQPFESLRYQDAEIVLQDGDTELADSMPQPSDVVRVPQEELSNTLHELGTQSDLLRTDIRWLEADNALDPELATLRQKYETIQLQQLYLKPQEWEGVELQPLLSASCQDALRGIVGERAPEEVLRTAALHLYAAENQCLLNNIPVRRPQAIDLIYEAASQLNLERDEAQTLLAEIDPVLCRLSPRELKPWVAALDQQDSDRFNQLPEKLKALLQDEATIADVNLSKGVETDDKSKAIAFRESLTVNDFRAWYRDAQVLRDTSGLDEIKQLAEQFKQDGWRGLELNDDTLKMIGQTQLSMETMKLVIESQIVSNAEAILRHPNAIQKGNSRTISITRPPLTLNVRGEGTQRAVSIKRNDQPVFSASTQSRTRRVASTRSAQNQLNITEINSLYHLAQTLQRRALRNTHAPDGR